MSYRTVTPLCAHGFHSETNCLRFPMLSVPPTSLLPLVSRSCAFLVVKKAHGPPARSYAKEAVVFFAYGNVAPAASHTRTLSSMPLLAAVSKTDWRSATLTYCPARSRLHASFSAAGGE